MKDVSEGRAVSEKGEPVVGSIVNSVVCDMSVV